MSSFAVGNIEEDTSSSDALSYESEETDQWVEEIERGNKEIERAIYHSSREFFDNAPKRWVQRCVFYNKNKTHVKEPCIDLDNGNVVCTRDMLKDMFTIELEQVKNDIEDWEEWGTVFPHAIDVYRRMVHSEVIPKTKEEKIKVLKQMVEQHGIVCETTDPKKFDRVIFSNWNSGCTHFLTHSVEKANIMLDHFIRDKKHIAILTFATDVKKGERLYINRFRHFMPTKMCFSLCKARSYDEHPILSSWTTVRNYCARLAFQMKQNQELDKVLVQYLGTVPGYLHNVVASLLLKYLFNHFTVTNTCEEFMKNLKHHPGLMKKFGNALRNILVKKIYKLWALEKSVLGKAMHVNHKTLLNGIG